MNLIQAKIDLFWKQKEILFEEFKAYCQNTNIPLEDRWKFLLKNSEFGELSDRTEFGLDRDDEFLYEGPLYMQKYEVWPVDDILEALETDAKFAITKDEILTFKQYCLDEGITKMKFDW